MFRSWKRPGNAVALSMAILNAFLPSLARQLAAGGLGHGWALFDRVTTRDVPVLVPLRVDL
jgi:hypothetical protein